MQPIYKLETTPCIVCGELIDKRRKKDGTFKKVQPRFCSYRCYYVRVGPLQRAARHIRKLLEDNDGEQREQDHDND